MRPAAIRYQPQVTFETMTMAMRMTMRMTMTMAMTMAMAMMMTMRRMVVLSGGGRERMGPVRMRGRDLDEANYPNYHHPFATLSGRQRGWQILKECYI